MAVILLRPFAARPRSRHAVRWGLLSLESSLTETRPARARAPLPGSHAGTGVLAKRADLRWRRTQDQISDLSDLQDQLLDAAAVFVRPGGLLVYSTCSIEDEEGVERVRAFLGRPAGADFELEPPAEGLLPAAVVRADGCLATLPHVHGVDGAFGARLRRRAGGGRGAKRSV